MRRDKRAGRKKSHKLWWKIPLMITGVAVIAIGVYGFTVYSDAKQTVEKQTLEPVKAIDTSLAKKKVQEAKEPLNILLMGVDERAGDRGRSDALMVLSLNPQSNSMQLISIPRDTRTEIVGMGFEDKINHAYAFGGTDMSILTVENLLDIELDYYVSMNMEGLAEMVDALGGITVQNELDWVDSGYYQKGFHYQKGKLQLDGEKTMGYVRMRYQDPEGDFGRTKRQRQIIKAIIDKGASMASINKAGDMIDVLGDNMKTNMDFGDMQTLLLNYRNTRENVVSYQMEGQGTYIKNTSGQEIYYLVVSEEEVAKVRNMIKKARS